MALTWVDLALGGPTGQKNFKPNFQGFTKALVTDDLVMVMMMEL